MRISAGIDLYTYRVIHASSSDSTELRECFRQKSSTTTARVNKAFNRAASIKAVSASRRTRRGPGPTNRLPRLRRRLS